MSETVSVPLSLLDGVVIASLKNQLNILTEDIERYEDLIRRETHPDRIAYYNQFLIEALRNEVALREALTYYGG
jgi:hypothetical protein